MLENEKRKKGQERQDETILSDLGERKLIFKARSGSKLYGTDTLESDDDFLGVFLPSEDDFLSMGNPAKECKTGLKVTTGARNSKGDVDCTLYSLKRFLKLAGDGQSWAFEMLFTPEEHILVATEEWRHILAHRDIFVSQNSVRAFIGFAVAQAIKTEKKGTNYYQIDSLIKAIENQNLSTAQKFLQQAKKIRDCLDKDKRFLGVDIKSALAQDGTDCVVVAAREFNLGLRVKTFKSSLEKMRDSYGHRSIAASQDSFDFKSLSHAYRLLSETKEILETGHVTFPRPDREFLKTIKQKQYVNVDYKAELDKMLDDIRAIQSPLPKSPNWKAINKLCIDLHRKVIQNCSTEWA